MKKIFLTVLVIFVYKFNFSQDIIIFKDGTEIEAKVFKITINEITYKKFENLNGPEYTEKKNNIFMIKYENGSKDVFKLDNENSDDNTNNERNKSKELFTINSGELITLFFKETLTSKDLSSGSLIRLGVKEDVISKSGKIIIAANTNVIGRVTNVKEAAWAGQKGKISIQINSIKAIDGTSIPVFYNLNNEGKSRQATAVGVGMLLFWPALFVKGKQATIEAGTLILVETMGSTTLDISNFPKANLQNNNINTEKIFQENISNEEIQTNTDDCGEKPIEPRNPFNKADFKNSNVYKSYTGKLKKWNDCMGY